MKLEVEPLKDRIVVRLIEPEDTYKGVLFIPPTAKDKPQLGEVLAAGPGKHEYGVFIPNDVRQGDRVMFGKYAGTAVHVGEQEFLILSGSDVLAKVRDAEAAE